MRKTLRQVHDELSGIRNVSTGDAREVHGHLMRGQVVMVKSDCKNGL
jgi:hypothetical protein